MPSDWVLGFADEVWWSRLAPPALQAWAEGQPLRLHEMTPPKDDPDPQAIACYGILGLDTQEVRGRFVDGGPVRHVTTAFLQWVCEQLKAEGKKTLLWVWDHACWHRRQEVRRWRGAHHRHATGSGEVGIGVGQLPIKRPWWNRLEPHWVHAKRAIVEPHRLLSKTELVDRIGSYFNGKYPAHLQQVIAKTVA